MSPDPESSPLLEVTVLHPRDAEAATRGEADRLLVLTRPEDLGRSADPAGVSAILRETDLPVRVMLRVADGLGIAGGEFARLVGLARDLRELGVAGFSFGFLDRDLEVDVATCTALAGTLGKLPWSFHRGFDSALDPDRAWRDVLRLPGLDAVASSGSTRGLRAGGDELVARCRANARVATLLLVSGGLAAEHVPWLVRGGVRQFGLGEEARLDGSWSRSYVDAGIVRAWRLLLDDAHQRALGVPVD